MDKQQTIERITEQLPYLGEDVLQSFLNLIENMQPEMDDWDRQILADAEAGKLDAIAERVLEDHRAGKTTDLFEGLEEARKART